MGISSSKKRLVFLRQHHTPFGGAENYLSRLTEVLKSQNIDFEIRYSKVPNFFASWIKAILYSLEVCISKKSELYFSLDRVTCPDIYRAGDGVHRAFLKTKGFTLNPLHTTLLYLEKKTFTNSKLIIANSKLVKEQIINFYPNTNKDKIHIVYNGIPIPKSFNKQEAKKRLSKEFNFNEDTPIILFVGSGFKRKGVMEFLEIISKLKEPFYALVVGKEKKISKYKQKAKELGVANSVNFTGARRDVAEFYQGADIFIFPTHYEPFSNVILEALSYGVVSITTKQNGASEVLPKEWIMQNPNDMSILKEIENLILDSKRVKEASKRAREIALKYPIERNVKESLELIKTYFR